MAGAAFAAHGYHNASLAEIAKEAGITAAGILHHFKTKDQLLTELLHGRDEADIADASETGELHGTDFLAHLVDTASRNAGRPGITQLYAVLSAESVTQDHPAQEWFRSRYEGLRRMVVDAVREATDGGPADEASIEEAATAIIAVMDGLQIQWLLSPDAVDMAAVTRRTIDSLLAPLLPAATSTEEA